MKKRGEARYRSGSETEKRKMEVKGVKERIRGVEMGGRGKEGEMKDLFLQSCSLCTRVWSMIFWSVSRHFLTVLV